MKIKKTLYLAPLGVLLLISTLPTHAESVYGKVGYHDDPWRIIVAYNDYDRGYRDRYHGHHHRSKHKHYHRHHSKHYHHKKYYHHRGHRYYRDRGRSCRR